MVIVKFDIRKSFQYKYIKYRFKKECLKNSTLQNLSEDEKEKIRFNASKRTRKITWIIIIIYIGVMCWFIFGFVGNYEYRNNTFVKWFKSIYESVYPFFTGTMDWGSTWHQRQASVLTIFVKLLPAVILQAFPLVIPIMVTANIILKTEQKKHLKLSHIKIHP